MGGTVRYSIIIPLEFHRGLTGRCIAGWTKHQTFSRDQFEVIVAAPASHAFQEREEVARQLGPQDRLIVLEADHDMPLVAEAAKIARGEVLVFTEAHCLPRPDFLEQATRVLHENPAWSGFSGRSIPITHNLLSEIEAGMYERDIQRNLETHPWLKVLDQCFVVRASAYRASGGVEPEYGHFAEWLLAARLHRARRSNIITAMISRSWNSSPATFARERCDFATDRQQIIAAICSKKSRTGPTDCDSTAPRRDACGGCFAATESHC